MKLSTIATVALLSTGVAAPTMTAQAAAQTQARPTDEQMMSEIATKIANHETLKADAVKVDVKDGVVTLSGLVGKDADKATAERLARVDGVVRVENNLKSREKATNAVTGTAGTVADATKTGAEKTADATKTAAKKTADATETAAKKTAGVTETAAKKTADATETAAKKTADVAETGAEKTATGTKKAAGATKDAVSKSGEKITDGWITSRIKTEYMADDTLKASSINVDTVDHVVTLRGAVPTEAAKTKAMDLAKKVEGVDRVVDSLKVTGK